MWYLITFLLYVIFVLFNLHNCPCFQIQLDNIRCLIMCSKSVSALCTQEIELITLHGILHMVKVHMNFLLNSHLYVVLQPMNTVCQKLRRKPLCAISSATTSAMPRSPEFVTSPGPENKAIPSVPPAKPGKVKYSLS